MTNLTLKRLIERAYGVQPFQIAGPGWIEEVRFDIVAKYPPDMKTEDRFLMLQTLLEDRLKVKTHRETRMMAGYALVKAKGGFKLKPVEPGDRHVDRNGDGNGTTLSARKAPMATLADEMARTVGETVADRTGEPGLYDFELRWTIADPNAAGGDTDRAAALLYAVQDALAEIGLRLERQKVAVEMLVVDHAERVPAEN